MKNFKSNYKMDLETYKEFSKGFTSTSMRYICARLIIFIYGVICILANQINIAIMIISIYIILFIIYKITGRNLIQYKRSLSLNNGKPVSVEITIDEKGISGFDKDKENKTNYSFDQILSIVETQNLIILKMKYDLGIIINKNDLEGGSKAEVFEFLFEKCQNIKNKKVSQGKLGNLFIKFYIPILIVLVVATFII